MKLNDWQSLDREFFSSSYKTLFFLISQQKKNDASSEAGERMLQKFNDPAIINYIFLKFYVSERARKKKLSRTQKFIHIGQK